MMTGLPKESEKDVIQCLEFIDRIKHHNVFVWMFPLMPLRSMRKQAAKWMPEYTPLRQQLILEATKHSVSMINRHASLLLKPIPAHLRFMVIEVLKYVSSKMLKYLEEAEDAIKHSNEDRLKLYKDLDIEVSGEGEAVLHIAEMVNELTSLQRLRNDNENV
jgi:radical SAM superfamily enzyme YgiQ (UPF0313 family)